MRTPSWQRPLWVQWLFACSTVVLLAYGLLCIILGFIVTAAENAHTGQRWSSHTAGEAKWNGTFVAALNADPSETDWHGRTITINEAWVEHQSQRVYTVVLVPGVVDIPINRQLPGYCIGMNLKQGQDCFIGSGHNAFFVRDDKREGFGEAWPSGLFWESLPDYDLTPINIKLVAHCISING